MNKKMKWGEEPEFYGPRHYFREGLILRNLRHYVPKDARILDAGSGNGSMSIRIGKAGYRSILGIDYSEALVAYSYNKTKKENLNNAVKFRKGNLLALDIENGYFEAVVSGEVIEHFEDDYQVVNEFQRVLKKGGFCIITVPAHPHLWDINDEWTGHFRRYTKIQLEQLFEKNGFKIKQCNYWGFPLIRLFHKFVYLPMVDRKIMKEGKNISREKSTLYRMLKNKNLHRLSANIFLIDNLFNFLPFGIGLLLVAKKI